MFSSGFFLMVVKSRDCVGNGLNPFSIYLPCHEKTTRWSAFLVYVSDDDRLFLMSYIFIRKLQSSINPGKEIF